MNGASAMLPVAIMTAALVIRTAVSELRRPGSARRQWAVARTPRAGHRSCHGRDHHPARLAPGTVFTAAGAAMYVLPGPDFPFPILFIGLAVLATGLVMTPASHHS